MCVNVTLSCLITQGEDPNEMQHKAAFHLGLHCKGKKRSSDKRIQYFFENYTSHP